MLGYTAIVVFVMLVAAAAPCVAQSEPLTLKSPDGAVEITIATVRPRAAQQVESGQAAQQGGVSGQAAPQAGGGSATQPASGNQLTPQAEGQLAYRVSFRGKPLLDWSNLGLSIEGTPVLGASARIDSSDASSHDQTWTSVAGKASQIRDHYNAITVQTTETVETGRRLVIEARAYDDGVAFRYVVPEQPMLKTLRIMNEATQFRFSKDATTWSLISRGFQTSNEGDYHQLTIRALHPEFLVNVPMLLEVPGVAWVGLTEAHLENYPGLFVTGVLDQNTLAARLATRVEDINTNADIAPSFDPKADAKMLSAITQAPMKSPWRVLLIAAEPGRLVESNLVMNLNPPCAISDPSWVKPGKSAWNWWNGSIAKGVQNPGMNNETMKYYIDFASRMGLEYMLIDAGWAYRAPPATNPTASSATGPTTAPGTPRPRPPVDLTRSTANIDVPMLVEYAKSKNVRIWLWAHFTDMNRQMDEALAQMEKWGVAGVKIDFMDRTDQWMTDWYRTVAKKAADHRLLVNFHGAFKPDGIERTYPNVLTREGVMGAEYNKWSARATPKHNVTLAFTRMLAGPMDYTPGGFDNVTREEFAYRNRAPMVMGTRAHQTALFVVMESALQCVADHPDAYEGQKETEFIKAVPATWDETRVLHGVPPKYVTIARRRGNEWFIGCITDEPRELDVPLKFLGSGNYAAAIYADGPDAATQPKESIVVRETVTAQTTLKLKLAPGGGAAVRLVPAQ